MSDAVASSALDGLLDEFCRCLDDESARRVAEFQVPERVQDRVDVLAERANEGLLSNEESSEYRALIDAADFIEILRLKVLRSLESKQPV